MTKLMPHFIDTIFSGFWPFMGFLLIVGLGVRTIMFVYNRTMRMLMVRKQGWPPAHIDADGDWPDKSSNRDH